MGGGDGNPARDVGFGFAVYDDIFCACLVSIPDHLTTTSKKKVSECDTMPVKHPQPLPLFPAHPFALLPYVFIILVFARYDGQDVLLCFRNHV